MIQNLQTEAFFSWLLCHNVLIQGSKVPGKTKQLSLALSGIVLRGFANSRGRTENKNEKNS
jgi:hypothetical protein